MKAIVVKKLIIRVNNKTNFLFLILLILVNTSTPI